NAAYAPQAVLDPVEPGQLRRGEPVVGAGIDRGVEVLERLGGRFDPLVVRLELSLNAASKNTTVSKPSRMTAQKRHCHQGKTRATASADVAAPSGWPFRSRECRFIQTTM